VLKNSSRSKLEKMPPRKKNVYLTFEEQEKLRENFQAGLNNSALTLERPISRSTLKRHKKLF
jgi:predicted DNA-binding protein (UPF0251 family)